MVISQHPSVELVVDFDLFCICVCVCRGWVCVVCQALGGVIASIANIITISLGSGPIQTGFVYFLIALAVTLGSLLLFFMLIRLASFCLLFCLKSFNNNK